MPVETTNRRLIRPPLAEPKLSAGSKAASAALQKKQVPPETTNAENYYYVKQMQAKTPMVILLTDGEELHGTIEWYDRTCIKLTRDGAPNVLLYKASIKYMYKADEEAD